MNLFVNDKHVKVINMDTFAASQSGYNYIIDGQTLEVTAAELVGDVAVVNPSVVLLYRLFALLRDKKLKKLNTLVLASPDKKILTDVIKGQYKIVEAAGGVVQKDDKILMIFRLGAWDLPKGKMDKGESFKETALREVEEECNVKVQLEHKICTTWHTYTQNGNRILKQTKWYAMTNLDDSRVTPQKEEGIEQIVWVREAQAMELAASSYRSIQFVCRRFYEKKREKMLLDF
ncbi:NUDIX hydrolase [Xanthocytophaga agilis]|uniref:NUDIX domain-containing protein n=1 Tax=Xanthocytophaga agilis TaxID=3048010 RepID=A0AAE3UJ80_9BACT|nr:NUDIX domain-containing protein [Xanthocytophaga agilis]MDJ1504753.1 NUDIX domain-containing protein [Xanthocytophaga agilis]